MDAMAHIRAAAICTAAIWAASIVSIWSRGSMPLITASMKFAPFSEGVFSLLAFTSCRMSPSRKSPLVVPIAEEVPDLAHCIERRQPDLRNEVTRWAHQFGRPALSSFSPGSRSASIRAFSTDGGKRRESSRPGRRSSSVMAVAAILPC